jgi:hypothetical protein
VKYLPNCRIILMTADTTGTTNIVPSHESGLDIEVLAKPIPNRATTRSSGSPAADGLAERERRSMMMPDWDTTIALACAAEELLFAAQALTTDLMPRTLPSD